MKKHILISLLAVLAVAVCVSCDLVEDAPSATTAETEAPTEIVTDLGHDDPTEPPTETLTEPLKETEEEITEPIPTDTAELPVFKDETLNALVDSYREEGYDMEQLTFISAEHKRDSYSCVAVFNGRAFRPGDTIEITLWEVTRYGRKVSPEDRVKDAFPQCQISDQMLSTTDGRTLTYVIPEDTESNTLWVVLQFDGEDVEIFGPIVVY